MSGSDLACELERRRPELPVLLMTGYAHAGQLRRTRQVIEKPFVLADLLASIAKVLPAR